VNIVTQGEQILQFPMNNSDYLKIPKISDIPKNNYDDRGAWKIKERAKLEVVKYFKSPRTQKENKLLSKDSESNISILSGIKYQNILERN